VEEGVAAFALFVIALPQHNEIPTGNHRRRHRASHLLIHIAFRILISGPMLEINVRKRDQILTRLARDVTLLKLLVSAMLSPTMTASAAFHGTPQGRYPLNLLYLAV